MTPKKRMNILVASACLSAGGSMLTTIALSACLFSLDLTGGATAFLQVVTLIGIAALGLAGGTILNRWNAAQIGKIAPLLSASISTALFVFGIHHKSTAYIAAFCFAILLGLDHPNNMRFFNQNLEVREKGAFFSRFQMFQQLSLVLAPGIASWMIRLIGTRGCFFLDALSFVLVSLAWLFVAPKRASETPSPVSTDPVSNWVGYQVIWSNPNVFCLNLYRFANHFVYTVFTVALPIWIARTSHGTLEEFTRLQAWTFSATSIGFILCGLVGSKILKSLPSAAVGMPVIASILGFCAVALSVQQDGPIILLFSAFLIGLGQYCFRMTGMVIGQMITPKESLGPVIVAGDTLTRFVSFLIGAAVPLMGGALLPLSFIGLAAPLVMKNVLRTYLAETKSYAEL